MRLTKIIQFHTLPIDTLHQQCIDLFQPKIPAGIDYEMMSALPCEYDDINIREGSDIIRCALLAANPLAAWFDTDCLITDFWIPPDDGKIYTSELLSIIFANNQLDVFNSMISDYNSKIFPHVPGWFIRLSKSDKYKSRFAPIPSGKFRHLGISGLIPGHNNWASASNTECAIINKNGTLTLDIR